MNTVASASRPLVRAPLSVQPDTAALVALLEGCANPGVTRRVLLVRMDELPSELAWPHHRRLVEAALEPLFRLDRSKRFRLADGTLLVAWRGAGTEEEAQVCEALRHLLAGLPTDPVELLDLPRDTPRIARAIAGSLGPVAQAVATPGGQALDPAGLAYLERALEQADVAPFARREAVCRWPATAASPETAWELRRLSVRDLGAALAPQTRLQADPWLFRRLTHSLDRRLLVLMSDAAELREAGPFQLDLNIASIVGPEFLRLDAALPARLRGAVTLGVLPADILLDTAAYLFAREFAHTRGYRLLLRGVTLEWLEVFPPALLQVALVELQAPADTAQALPHGVDATGLVLAEVTEPGMLQWGRQQGIELFRGPAVRP